MKLFFRILLVYGCLLQAAVALEVTHKMETSIGIFDACEQTLVYGFYRDKDYDIKTTLKTTGTFGTFYPFKAMYHAVGTYQKQQFKPQDYFYEAKSAFRYRTKEIVYQNGVPQFRVSTKDEKKRTDDIHVEDKYAGSVDLLSTFALLIEQIVRKNDCTMERYSFSGKKYALSTVKSLGKEKVKTPYFQGKALKCEYHLEVIDEMEAGFLLGKDEPIYFWILRDEKHNAPFVAKILVNNTPFGKLESLTTKIEVKK